MQTLNYWKQFENTGKITDYLSYREQSEHSERREDTYRMAENVGMIASGRERANGADPMTGGMPRG